MVKRFQVIGKFRTLSMQQLKVICSQKLPFSRKRHSVFADAVAQVHCGPETSTSNSIELDFIDLIAAYVPISIWQAGPMNQNEGVLRFQRWPDGKGFAKRAVDRAIRDQNQSLLNWQNICGHKPWR